MQEVQRAQPGPARAVTTASPGDKVVTSGKSARSKELEHLGPPQTYEVLIEKLNLDLVSRILILNLVSLTL